MKKEYIEVLNTIIPIINKRTDFNVTWLANLKMQVHDSDTDITITDYLVNEGFADYFDNNIYNILSAEPWHSRWLVLLDKGRKLKDCGSVEEFNRVSLAEERRLYRLDQTVLNTFRVNLCIGVSTLIAALYYIWQFGKEYWGDYKLSYPRLSIFVFGIIVGIVILRTIQELVRRKSKNPKNPL